VFYDLERAELDGKYERISAEAAAEEWRAAYVTALRRCIHGPACKEGAGCTVRRLQIPPLARSLRRSRPAPSPSDPSPFRRRHPAPSPPPV